MDRELGLIVTIMTELVGQLRSYPQFLRRKIESAECRLARN